MLNDINQYLVFQVKPSIPDSNGKGNPSCLMFQVALLQTLSTSFQKSFEGKVVPPFLETHPELCILDSSGSHFSTLGRSMMTSCADTHSFTRGDCFSVQILWGLFFQFIRKHVQRLLPSIQELHARNLQPTHKISLELSWPSRFKKSPSTRS